VLKSVNFVEKLSQGVAYYSFRKAKLSACFNPHFAQKDKKTDRKLG
jgi:hypothetical protein